MFFWRVLGEAFGEIRRIDGVQPVGQGVPGKGRVGIKPLPKGMWVVGLKKDCGLWIETPLRPSKRLAQGPGLADLLFILYMSR